MRFYQIFNDVLLDLANGTHFSTFTVFAPFLTNQDWEYVTELATSPFAEVAQTYFNRIIVHKILEYPPIYPLIDIPVGNPGTDLYAERCTEYLAHGNFMGEICTFFRERRVRNQMVNVGETNIELRRQEINIRELLAALRQENILLTERPLVRLSFPLQFPTN